MPVQMAEHETHQKFQDCHAAGIQQRSAELGWTFAPGRSDFVYRRSRSVVKIYRILGKQNQGEGKPSTSELFVRLLDNLIMYFMHVWSSS